MDKIQEFEKTQIKKNFPDIKPGDTVRVHQKIKEENAAKGKKGEKERIQVFEGVVLRIRGGKGMNGSFLVRKITSGVGVEKNFPIHLPSIVKVEVVKRGKVRRARLYYLRDKKEKEARLKEIKLTDKDLEKLKYEEETEKPVKEKKDKEVDQGDNKADKKEDKKIDKPEDKKEVKDNKADKKPEDKKEEPKKEEKPKKEDKKDSKK